MSRRRKRSAARKTPRKSPPKERKSPPKDPPPPADHERPAGRTPHPPKPRTWLLALAILLQAGWLAFLLVMACLGRSEVWP